MEVFVLTTMCNHDTGLLIWKKSCASVGSCNNKGNGHSQARLHGRVCHQHRVAWAMCHGKDPGSLQADHANENRSDNRIVSLRLATVSQNDFDKILSNRNKTGVTGASWDKSKKKWCATISPNGVTHGERYDNQTHAITARCSALLNTGHVENSLQCKKSIDLDLHTSPMMSECDIRMTVTSSSLHSHTRCKFPVPVSPPINAAIKTSMTGRMLLAFLFLPSCLHQHPSDSEKQTSKPVLSCDHPEQCGHQSWPQEKH